MSARLGSTYVGRAIVLGNGSNTNLGIFAENRRPDSAKISYDDCTITAKCTTSRMLHTSKMDEQ